MLSDLQIARMAELLRSEYGGLAKEEALKRFQLAQEASSDTASEWWRVAEALLTKSVS